MTTHTIGVDVGTTGTKTVLLDTATGIVAPRRRRVSIGTTVEDGAVLHVDQPVDAGVGPGRAQGGGQRQGVDDVAEGAEPDDQQRPPARVPSGRRAAHGVRPRTAATRSFVE